MKEGRTVYHLAFGQSPFPVMEIAREQLRQHAGVNAYLPMTGIPELRRAICEFHREYDGLQFSPNGVVVGPGSKELIFLLLSVFNGDVFLLSPSWTTYKPQAILAHHRPFIINTESRDEWRLTPERLEEGLKRSTAKNKLIILCNPDNPTGTSYPEQACRELAAALRRNRVLVLSDEIYGRLHFANSHCSLAKFYPEGTILCSGLSKWASAGGWRLGYHVYPPTLRQLHAAVRAAASHTYSCASAPIQYAALACFSPSEEAQAYMAHTRRIMAAVAEYSYKHLIQVGLKIAKPQGGFYMFPDFEILRGALANRGIVTCQKMCDAIFEECLVTLMPGGPPFLRPVDEFTVRLCYVNFDGAKALTASKAIGLQVQLTDEFVTEHCSLIAQGILALKEWIVKQQSSVKNDID